MNQNHNKPRHAGMLSAGILKKVVLPKQDSGQDHAGVTGFDQLFPMDPVLTHA